MRTLHRLPETMYRALRTAPLPLSLLCLCACERTDQVPAYLDLGSASVATDLANEGSGSSKITDAWVYVNDQAAGVWEVPSKVPVLASGSINIKVIAGVPRNGVLDDRVQYPFYATYSVDHDLAPEAHTSITPVFTYFDGLQFFVEDFEGVGFALDVEADSDTTLDPVTDPSLVFGGIGRSAVVHLDSAHNLLRCSTFEVFDISNGPVYVELDYRCDHKFLVGVYYTQSSTVVRTPYLYVNSTKRADGGMPWNKIYVDLSELLLVPGTGDKKFYIETLLEPGETSAVFYFDNLKLIHP